MLVWLITILIASLAVIGGIYFLQKARIPEPRKATILLVIGILIYVSLTISHFKQKRIFNFSLLNSRHRNEIQNLFTGDIHQWYYVHRDKIHNSKLSQLDYTHFYQKNYPSFPFHPNYQQKLVFKSNKFDGASKFLMDLAEYFRSENTPTLYVQLTDPIIITDLNQFASLFGLPNFLIMREALLSYKNKKVRSYMIIDNPENMLFHANFDGQNSGSNANKYGLTSPFQQLVDDAQISLIFNIENGKSYGNLNRYLSMGKFQVRRWQKPAKQDFQFWLTHLADSLGVNKQRMELIRVPFIDFRSLAVYAQPGGHASGSGSQQLYQKSNIMRQSVSGHFYVDEVLKKIRQTPSVLGGPTKRVSEMRKYGVTIDQLRRLQQLGLIEVYNGQVSIK